MLLDLDLIASSSQLLTPEDVKEEWGVSGILKRKVLVALDLHACQIRVVENLSIGINSLANFPLPDGSSRDASSFVCVVLSLRQNNLRVLQGLEEVPRLRVLDVSVNQLAGLGPSLQHLSNLRVLNVSQNMITSIQGIGRCKHLVDLDISMNDVEELGPELLQLTKIRRLNLDGNRLQNLDGLERLTELVYLSANHNQIENIGEIHECTLLQELHVAHNQVVDVDQLDEQIRHLNQLKTLNMAGCPVTSEPTYRLKMLKHGNILELDRQEISEESRARIMRHVIRSLQAHQVNDMVQNARKEYTGHLKSERFKVQEAVAALQKRQEQLQLEYSKYAEQMNAEMHDVIAHLETADQKPARLRARDVDIRSVVPTPAVGPKSQEIPFEKVKDNVVVPALAEHPQLWTNKAIRGGGQTKKGK